MKSGLILGVVAALLFAVTAGLSILLNQTKTGEETQQVAKTEKRKDGPNRGAGEKDGNPKPVVRPTPGGDASESLQFADQLKNDLVRVAQREEEVNRQKELHGFLLEDMRDEMVDLQKVFQKAAAETQRRADSATTSPLPPAGPKPPVAEPATTKPASGGPKSDNLRTATGISESMAPENAAKILEQMAKSGKTDAAVQLLTRMSPRHAAKILALISDEKISGQLFEKLMEAQQPAPPGAKP